MGEHSQYRRRKNQIALFLRRDKNDQDSQNMEKAGENKSLKKKAKIAVFDEIRQIEKIFRKREKKTNE